MTQTNVLVSIAMVTRNRRDLLAKAIRSAYMQTYRPLEYIVVDNNSQDDTVAMVELNWPDIKVIRVHKNIGCQPGRNIAMKNCKGKYIFNLDDDGELDPLAIENIVNRFELDPEIAVIECSTPALEQKCKPVNDASMRERWQANFRGGASAIRASILDRAGYFPEFPRTGAETVLAARILDCGSEILHLPSAIMFHPEERKRQILREQTYYAGWHYLKRPFLYLPFPECLINGFWRCLRGFGEACKNKFPGAYLTGVFRFILDLPDVIEKRKPIKREALKKISFLAHNAIEQKNDVCKYTDSSFLKVLLARWRKWLKCAGK
jgi:GT2 family glycosyltransferase